MFYAEKAVRVGKPMIHTVTVPAKSLGGTPITSHNVTSDQGISVGSTGVIDNVIGMSLTGVSAGFSDVHVSWSWDGGNQSDCETIRFFVEEDCA